MRNNKEREEAYLQARSYARLLNSSVIVLCDKDYLIVYEKKTASTGTDTRNTVGEILRIQILSTN